MEQGSAATPALFLGVAATPNALQIGLRVGALGAQCNSRANLPLCSLRAAKLPKCAVDAQKFVMCNRGAHLVQ